MAESLLKAIRSLEDGKDHIYMEKFDGMPAGELLRYIAEGTDDRIYAIAQLLRISQGAVKQRLVTGRNHFKEQYEARERRAQS